ncbi:tRNA A64-2'-O-ribosylphosphate transferase [Infundibulicybe gibba]|nr:tRNA A64-2'-O-ribosylphosphate transferase [Infundibulicybe gibba]
MEHTSIESGALATPKDLNVAALAYLRRESLDLSNRLHSIIEDVKFVEYVHNAYPSLPILPNLRCGAWYVNPIIAEKWPAYFKSTDGHFSNWSSIYVAPTCTYYLTLLRAAGDHHTPISHFSQINLGPLTRMVLVDSTRSGKRIPDALSKTVPIWCAVINRAIHQLYPDVGFDWDVGLYTPPNAGSAFVVPRLPLPLRPFWITPATTTLPLLPAKADATFIPIVCLSASKAVSEGLERRSAGFSYIQGSGDDHELWGMGLTPDLFWRHQNELLSANRAELPDFVTHITSSGGVQGAKMPPSPIIKTGSRVFLCALSDLSTGVDSVPQVTATIDGKKVDYSFLTLEPEPSDSGNIISTSDNHLRVPVTEGKRGQIQFLEDVLPRSMDYIEAQMLLGKHICIACETGNDASVGVAVAALQKFFDDEGKIRQSDSSISQMGDKKSIRTRLQWIIASRPQANPSRATLKRVNEFFLSPSSFRKRPTK